MSATSTRSRGTKNGEAETDLATREAQFLQDVNSRIGELEGFQNELARLRSIKAALEGRPMASSQPSATRPRATRRQGRLQEFVKLANDRPGITISEAAKEMNVANNYLYRVTAKGISEGLIRKDGSNFYAVEAQPAA